MNSAISPPVNVIFIFRFRNGFRSNFKNCIFPSLFLKKKKYIYIYIYFLIILFSSELDSMEDHVEVYCQNRDCDNLIGVVIENEVYLSLFLIFIPF